MLDLLKKRRSIRKFSTKEIECEKIEKIKTAALLSPSSRNIKPWNFIFIQESKTLHKLSSCRPNGASFIKDSKLAIVIIADTTLSDVWIEDCSIASIIIQLAAENLELGSCWTQIRNRQYSVEKSTSTYIKELLSIPKHFEVESIISIGYKAEEKQAYREEDLSFQAIHQEKFN